MKNKKVVIGIGVVALIAFSTFLLTDRSGKGLSLTDQALLSIIRNDQAAFEKYISSGGKLDTVLEVEGKHFMIGELLVKYERANFIKHALDKKLEFAVDKKKDFDIYSLAVTQNNPEILSLLISKKANLNAKTYGENKWNLLQMANARCSHKVIDVLQKAGMSWKFKAKDGKTALTLAAEEGCIQALSYWKEKGADFRFKDGTGRTALGILEKKKDSALSAFGESIGQTVRKSASILASATAPNFYKKRVNPKTKLSDFSHLIEPEERPDEANDTADISEFSD